MLISVGGLVERKEFHRVIACLPELRGPRPEGDWSARLQAQVAAAGLTESVRFLGPLPPAELHKPSRQPMCSSSLPSNEGRANGPTSFEAMLAVCP